MTASTLENIEGFRDKWPFDARYARVNGWRMHYVDEGSGAPILLLHGNPTWGFLYRRVIPPLVDAGHRVIVPDMIGFGLSEKPAREQAHSLDGNIANLAGLVRQLDPPRRQRPRTSAVYLARSEAGKVQTAGPDYLGPRGRSVRRWNLR